MAVSLISGAVIERIHFITWIVFSSLWSLVVYPVIVHWVWSE